MSSWSRRVFRLDVRNGHGEESSTHLVTREVMRELAGVARSGRDAVLHLFVRSPAAAALTLNENCDPSVGSDLTRALRRLLPHDPHGHARAALLGCRVALPLAPSGAPCTGTWQGIHLWALRGAARGVEVVATVAPATNSSFHVVPPSRGALPIAAQAERCVAPSSRLCVLLARHTSCSVVLATRGPGAKDLEAALSATVPDEWSDDLFEHTYEGRDDMPAHAKCSIAGACAVLPTAGHRLRLDEMQDVLLLEHRDGGGWGGGGRRTVAVASVDGGNAASDIELSVPFDGRDWVAIGQTVLADKAAGVAVGLLSVQVVSRGVAIVVGAAGCGNELHTALGHVVSSGGCDENATVLGLSVLLPVCDGHIDIGAEQDVFVLATAGQRQQSARLLLTLVGDKQ